MSEVKRIWGIEMDKVACDSLGIDVDHYTVTASSTQIMVIDDFEDLQEGYRLLGLSDVRDKSKPRKFAIVDLSNFGFK